MLLARDSLEEVVESVSEKMGLDIPPGGFKTLKNERKGLYSDRNIKNSFEIKMWTIFCFFFFWCNFEVKMKLEFY